MQDITVRQMEFSFPAELDPYEIAETPEDSYLMVGLSLLLPYLEPYLIRTMKEAKKRITDPDLRADLEHFSAQEGAHYRQHILFNEAIRGAGFPGLADLEEELDADYRRFSDEKPLEWNLAYAEGFEALTTATAHHSFETRSSQKTHPAYADLITWHMIEELEHRTVAFDVYEHVCGRYGYRLRVGTWAQWHMASWINRVKRYMLETDPRTKNGLPRDAKSQAIRRARRWENLRGLLPKILRTYMPWYTPHAIPMTDEMRALADSYTARAVRVR